MSDHATKAVDAVARATSRRGFLKRLTRVAGTAAAGLGGVLAAASVRGGRPQRLKWCCGYVTHEGFIYHCTGAPKCPGTHAGYPLRYQFQVANCKDC